MPIGKNPLSPATTALGFAQGPGDQLVQQRDDQVEEERRKKLLGTGGASPAVLQLFGMQGMAA